ncbi:MAG TPA: FAD-binding oxidoreductase, partial [Desulfobacterales bacterium]|nr:FAD-binding oxidoreductase [Desulfobacterales bacterium]
ILLGKEDDKPEWSKIWEISDRLVHKAIELGGTASGEHGIGIGKRRYMAHEHGEALQWMKSIKALFDPNQILNPGKIL